MLIRIFFDEYEKSRNGKALSRLYAVTEKQTHKSKNKRKRKIRVREHQTKKAKSVHTLTQREKQTQRADI